MSGTMAKRPRTPHFITGIGNGNVRDSTPATISGHRHSPRDGTFLTDADTTPAHGHYSRPNTGHGSAAADSSASNASNQVSTQVRRSYLRPRRAGDRLSHGRDHLVGAVGAEQWREAYSQASAFGSSPAIAIPSTTEPWQVSMLTIIGILAVMTAIFLMLVSDSSSSQDEQHAHSTNARYNRRRNRKYRSQAQKKKSDEWIDDEDSSIADIPLGVPTPTVADDDDRRDDGVTGDVIKPLNEPIAPGYYPPQQYHHHHHHPYNRRSAKDPTTPPPVVAGTATNSHPSSNFYHIPAYKSPAAANLTQRSPIVSKTSRRMVFPNIVMPPPSSGQGPRPRLATPPEHSATHSSSSQHRPPALPSTSGLKSRRNVLQQQKQQQQHHHHQQQQPQSTQQPNNQQSNISNNEPPPISAFHSSNSSASNNISRRIIGSPMQGETPRVGNTRRTVQPSFEQNVNVLLGARHGDPRNSNQHQNPLASQGLLFPSLTEDILNNAAAAQPGQFRQGESFHPTGQGQQHVQQQNLQRDPRQKPTDQDSEAKDDPLIIPFIPTLEASNSAGNERPPQITANPSSSNMPPPQSIHMDLLRLEQMESGNSPHWRSTQHDADEDADDEASDTYRPDSPTLSYASEYDDISIPSDDPRKAIVHKRSQLTLYTDAERSLQSRGIAFDELQLIEVIGGGGFGQVWRATWHGTPVAVKVLTGSAQNKQIARAILEEFKAEINLLKGMRHPNICLYMGASLDPPNRAIITELAANGSVWDALRLPLSPPYKPMTGSSRSTWPPRLYAPDQQHGVPPTIGQPRSSITIPAPPKGTWPWELVQHVARGAACGMAYLHSGKPPVLHRDLKSANLLLDESYRTKVCDFGLSRLKAQDRSMTGNCGTVQWMAPEVLANESYNEKADVFSYGIILWELLTRQCPYDGMSAIQCALAVLNRDARPDMPKWCPPPLYALIQACIKKSPSERPSFDQIIMALDAIDG